VDHDAAADHDRTYSWMLVRPVTTPRVVLANFALMSAYFALGHAPAVTVLALTTAHLGERVMTA
jgi:hypothetical protein